MVSHFSPNLEASFLAIPMPAGTVARERKLAGLRGDGTAATGATPVTQGASQAASEPSPLAKVPSWAWWLGGVAVVAWAFLGGHITAPAGGGLKGLGGVRWVRFSKRASARQAGEARASDSQLTNMLLEQAQQYDAKKMPSNTKTAERATYLFALANQARSGAMPSGVYAVSNESGGLDLVVEE